MQWHQLHYLMFSLVIGYLYAVQQTGIGFTVTLRTKSPTCTTLQ